MRIQLISNIANMPINRRQWNALASQNKTNTPFQTYEWFKSWWSVFGEGHDLFLLLIHEGEKVIGLAPFMIDLQQNSRVLKFIGDVNTDYCDFITSHDKTMLIKVVLDYLLENQSQWDSLSLRNIPEYSNTASILEKILPDYGLLFLKSSVACPVLMMEDLQSAAPWKHSRTLKRHLNYFKKNGDLVFKKFNSLDDALNSLEPFFEQHIKRWDLANQPSLFCNNRYKDFYRNLLQEAWPTGWLFFSCLQFNDHPIAFHFGFDYNSRVIWYKPSFDIDFRKRSPGKILLKDLIEYCILNNKEEFDFTLGDEPFKLQYTDRNRTNYHLQIFKNKMDYFVEKTNTRSRKMIKKIFHTLRKN